MTNTTFHLHGRGRWLWSLLLMFWVFSAGFTPVENEPKTKDPEKKVKPDKADRTYHRTLAKKYKHYFEDEKKGSAFFNDDDDDDDGGDDDDDGGGSGETCPTPVINPISAQVCPGVPVTYSAVNLGFPCLEYSWNFGAGASPPTASGIGPHTVVYSSSGSKTVTLSYTNNCNSDDGDDDDDGDGDDDDGYANDDDDDDGGSGVVCGSSGFSDDDDDGDGDDDDGIAGDDDDEGDNGDDDDDGCGDDDDDGDGDDDDGIAGDDDDEGDNGDDDDDGDCACMPCNKSTTMQVSVNCGNPPPSCTSPGELVYWNLNACNASNSSNASSYNEFVPTYPTNGNCSSVTATKVFRNSGTHSCTAGINNSQAMCVGAMLSCTWVDNSSSAIRFEVTISPNAGQTGSLSGLSFYEQAPNIYSWTGGASGTNNYPTKFGIRVTKNGQEVFKQIGIPTQRSWTFKNFDFASDPDFTVSQTTTFKFELLPYCKVGNNGSVSAWDIDEIKILGCCSTPPPPCSLTASVANIQCNDNGTPGNPGDDKFSFTLTVTGNNAGSGWNALINGQSVSGSYGVPKNLGPYLISGGPLNFDVKDNANTNCKTNVIVNPPAPCSNVPAPASYGNFVWNDTNKNGIQDFGEPGVQGVTVKLFKCDGTFVAQMTTNVNGQYFFTGLASNMQYFAEFSGLPAGFQFTTPNAGSDNVDSDASPANGRTECTFLSPGEIDDTWDAGIFQTPPQNGSIGDFVWNDLNKNGIQDGGEPGIQGVTVRLKNCQNAVLSVTTTGPNGSYLFSNLPAGCYRVGVDLPAGFIFSPQDQGGNDAIDSDVIPATAMTGDINLGQGQNNLTVDAGIHEQPQTGPAKIGDFVWFDTNGNGIQDAGEPGIPNVFVILETCNGAFVNFAVTDANGVYMFNNVQPGQYRIKFASPGTFNGVPVQFTAQNAGNDDAKDSDADWLGFTACFTLGAGETNLTLDAGLTGETPPPVCTINGTVSNKVCNNNGTPNNPGDDTYTFSLVVNGSNTGDWGFDIPALNLFMLNYGTTYNLGPFNISAGPLNLQIFDHDVTGCGATVTVNPPAPCSSGGGTPTLTLTCPANVSVTAPAGQNGAIVNYPAPTASSTCTTGTVNVTSNPASGSFFPLGATTVSVTATDGCGNTKNCSFTVTVTTEQGGNPNCDGITISASQGTLTIGGLTAPIVMVQVFNSANWQTAFSCSGNCSTPTQVVPNLPAGSYFVKVTFLTASWQQICVKEVTVNVGGGGGTPILTLTCPANMTVAAAPGQNGAIVNYPAPTATTTCTVGVVNVTTNPASGSFFPVGTTTVYVTATDGCGNTKTCSFTVTVNPGSGGCDNVTNGGAIGYDETNCAPYDPAPIVSLTLPSGGSGAIEYIWLSSTAGCPDDLSQSIPGTNSPTYDPPFINKTTWYVRCSRRVGCTQWIESNCIKKEVCTPSGGCNINFTNGPGSITVSGISAPNVDVKVFNAAWQQVFTCFNNCNNPQVISGLTPGTYYVIAQTWNSSWAPLCNKEGYVTVSSQLIAPQQPNDPAALQTEQIAQPGRSVQQASVLPNRNDLPAGFKLFPNPASNKVTVVWEVASPGQPAEIVIFNQLGQQVKTVQLQDGGAGNLELDIAQLRDGQYLVSLRLEGEAPVNKKLIVTR